MLLMYILLIYVLLGYENIYSYAVYKPTKMITNYLNIIINNIITFFFFWIDRVLLQNFIPVLTSFQWVKYIIHSTINCF